MSVRVNLGLTSITMILGVTFISAYLYTVPKVPEALFPWLLSVSGIAIMNAMGISKFSDDFEEVGKPQNWVYIAIAIAVFLFTGLSVRYIQLDIVRKLSVIDASLFVSLMGVSEEAFFRGGMTSLIYKYTKKGEMGQGNVHLACLVSGVGFALYHLAVYQDLNSIIFVVVAGYILSYVFIRSKSLYPGIVAHVTNNVLGVLLSGLKLAIGLGI